MSDIVLAVDLGGTNIRMAAVSADGQILHTVRRSTPRDISPLQLMDLTEILSNECREAAVDNFKVKGLAFGSPSPAAKDCDGTLTKLPNLPTLNGMDLASALYERFSLPVTLENDATAAAIGEHWMGAARGTSDSIMITLGTGVGGGLVINGEPYRGIDGTAGEIGHMCIEPDGQPCGCGSRGCIEQYASATGIVRMARESGSLHNSALEVYTAAKNGDEFARAVFNKMGRYLGITLASLVNVLNPEMIVIGGGVAAGWDAFIGPLEEEIGARSFEAPARRARVTRSRLGDNAGLLGVARSAFLSMATKR